MSTDHTKVAVVTGGGRGIGAAIARRLGDDGTRVAVVDVDLAAASATATAISQSGGDAIGIGCDVSEDADVDAAVAAIGDRWGGIDILVNNAGVIRDNLLFRMSNSDWDTVMNVHLRGAFLWARAAQAHMVQQQWGKIVNLSSMSAYGSRGQANYSAAKAGIQGFTKTLAIELGPFNVNVNAVAPGFIASEMTRSTAERVGMTFEDYQAQFVPTIPLRRVGLPEDIANVVHFLVGEDSSYVSGQVIDVGGGPAV